MPDETLAFGFSQSGLADISIVVRSDDRPVAHLAAIIEEQDIATSHPPPEPLIHFPCQSVGVAGVPVQRCIWRIYTNLIRSNRPSYNGGSDDTIPIRRLAVGKKPYDDTGIVVATDGCV